MNLAISTRQPERHRRPPWWVRFVVPVEKIIYPWLCLVLAFIAFNLATPEVVLAVVAVFVCVSVAIPIWIWRVIRWMDRNPEWPPQRR